MSPLVATFYDGGHFDVFAFNIFPLYSSSSLLFSTPRKKNIEKIVAPSWSPRQRLHRNAAYVLFFLSFLTVVFQFYRTILFTQLSLASPMMVMVNNDITRDARTTQGLQRVRRRRTSVSSTPSVTGRVAHRSLSRCRRHRRPTVQPPPKNKKRHQSTFHEIARNSRSAPALQPPPKASRRVHALGSPISPPSHRSREARQANSSFVGLLAQLKRA